MKFLSYTHANPLIQGSGGEKYLQGFLESLAEEGNFCLCLSSNEEKWKKKKHNGVFYEHENNITLEEEIEKIKPDFIITQFFKSERAIKEAHKNKIRVIYLVHNDFEISTGRELRLLKENGHKVFICTGRPLCDLDDYILELGFDGIVAAGGAYVEAYGHIYRNIQFNSKEVQKGIKANNNI